MLGRQVTFLLRRPLQARLARPIDRQQLHARALFSNSARAHATPGRPEKAVGEPSRPVKRAVKANAKKPNKPASDPAAKRVAARKTEAEKKKAAAAKAKATASKQKEAEKRKKALEKQKAAAAKKKAADAKKKAAAKKPAALTEEQQAKRQTRLRHAEVKELKALALKAPPVGSRVSAWTVYLKNNSKQLAEGQKGTSSADDRRQALVDHTRELSRSFKELSPAELENLNHEVNALKSSRASAYKSWVESHTPETIASANRARARLNRLASLVSLRPKHYTPIADERAPKRPVSAFTTFTMNRHASGDFRGITLPESAKLLSREWKALEGGERKKYENLYASDYQRYKDEYSSIYGHAPGTPTKTPTPPPQQQQAAAAAA